MKDLGYQDIGVGLIQPDKELFRNAKKSAYVKAIAEDIPAIGLLHPPWCRRREGVAFVDLLHGHVRYAAVMKAGVKTLLIRLVECSDDEAAMIRGAENGHRRNEARFDKITPELVELRQKILAERNGEPATKAEAHESIAEERGVTPNAVKVSEARERRRRREDSAPTDPPPADTEPPEEEPTEPPPEEDSGPGGFPDFDRRGEELTKEYLEYIWRLREELGDVEMWARRGAEGLELLSSHNDPQLEPLKGAAALLRQLQVTVQGLVPMSVCGECLGSGTQGEETCSVCKGSSWVP